MVYLRSTRPATPVLYPASERFPIGGSKVLKSSPADRVTVVAAGITDMEAANRYLREVYMPAFNAEFACPAPEEGSAFVPWIGGNLDDILCEQHERTVGNDNCVRFEGLILQIPADRHRCHYVKAKVRVHRYADGNLAVFHGPRKLSDYNREGKILTQNSKQAA